MPNWHMGMQSIKLELLYVIAVSSNLATTTSFRNIFAPNDEVYIHLSFSASGVCYRYLAMIDAAWGGQHFQSRVLHPCAAMAANLSGPRMPFLPG